MTSLRESPGQSFEALRSPTVTAGDSSSSDSSLVTVRRVACKCGHGLVFHNLSAKSERTACSTSTGPDAVPCRCRRYAAAEEQA